MLCFIIYINMNMKKFKKIFFALLIALLCTYIIIRIINLAQLSPSGVYVSNINSRDTLKLYPNGKFEQIVYNKNNILVYSSISTWKKTSMGISIDSILIYDNINNLNYWKEYPLEGERYTGWKFEYINRNYILSWSYYVDNPEMSLNYIRVNDLKE